MVVFLLFWHTDMIRFLSELFGRCKGAFTEAVFALGIVLPRRA